VLGVLADARAQKTPREARGESARRDEAGVRYMSTSTRAGRRDIPTIVAEAPAPDNPVRRHCFVLTRSQGVLDTEAMAPPSVVIDPALERARELARPTEPSATWNATMRHLGVVPGTLRWLGLTDARPRARRAARTYAQIATRLADSNQYQAACDVAYEAATRGQPYRYGIRAAQSVAAVLHRGGGEAESAALRSALSQLTWSLPRDERVQVPHAGTAAPTSAQIQIHARATADAATRAEHDRASHVPRLMALGRQLRASAFALIAISIIPFQSIPGNGGALLAAAAPTAFCAGAAFGFTSLAVALRDRSYRQRATQLRALAAQTYDWAVHRLQHRGELRQAVHIRVDSWDRLPTEPEQVMRSALEDLRALAGKSSPDNADAARHLIDATATRAEAWQLAERTDVAEALTSAANDLQTPALDRWVQTRLRPLLDPVVENEPGGSQVGAPPHARDHAAFLQGLLLSIPEDRPDVRQAVEAELATMGKTPTETGTSRTPSHPAQEPAPSPTHRTPPQPTNTTRPPDLGR